MKLNELKPKAGARQKRKRVGRGDGSGHGGTSTRGHKGQLARTGGGTHAGFEGGQMPLQRRLPKRGFTNIFHAPFEVVNVGDIAKETFSGDVTKEELVAKGLVRKNRPIKVLGDGELKKALKIHADQFSSQAKKKIEQAGGEVKVI